MDTFCLGLQSVKLYPDFIVFYYLSLLISIKRGVITVLNHGSTVAYNQIISDGPFQTSSINWQKINQRWFGTYWLVSEGNCRLISEHLNALSHSASMGLLCPIVSRCFGGLSPEDTPLRGGSTHPSGGGPGHCGRTPRSGHRGPATTGTWTGPWPITRPGPGPGPMSSFSSLTGRR